MADDYHGSTVPDADDSDRDLLMKIASALSGLSNLPRWDSRTITYVGSTNNPATIVYALSGSTVATRRFTYVGAGASNNDNIATESISY